MERRTIAGLSRYKTGERRMTPRILIAGIDESDARRLFADCDVTLARTMDGVRTALAQHYDALLVAVRFDESRMFDLLRHMKSDTTLSQVPIVCYESGRRALKETKLGRKAVELASRALGVDDFVDGQDNTELRETVFRVIATRHMHTAASHRRTARNECHHGSRDGAAFHPGPNLPGKRDYTVRRIVNASGILVPSEQAKYRCDQQEQGKR